MKIDFELSLFPLSNDGRVCVQRRTLKDGVHKSVALRVFENMELAEQFIERARNFCNRHVKGKILQPLPILAAADEAKVKVKKLQTTPATVAEAYCTEKNANDFLTENAVFFPELFETQNSGHQKQRHTIVGPATWQDSTGSLRSEMALATKLKVTSAIRLIPYAEPINHGGPLNHWGVEHVLLDESDQVIWVESSSLCRTEELATLEFQKLCDAHTSASHPTEQVSARPPSKEEEDTNLRDLKARLAKATDATGRRGLQVAINKIEEDRQQKAQAEAEAKAKQQRILENKQAAQDKIRRERYPEIHRVKDLMDRATPEQLPLLRDSLRQAIVVDFVRNRVGIPPGLQDGLGMALLSKISKALKKADPRDAAEWEIALNWDRYMDLKPADYTAEINRVTGGTVSVGAMEKKVRKLGFTSERPEGRPPVS